MPTREQQARTTYYRIATFALLALLVVVTLGFLGVAVELQGRVDKFCASGRVRTKALTEFLVSDAALQAKLNAKGEAAAAHWDSLSGRERGDLRDFLVSDATLRRDEVALNSVAAEHWRSLVASLPSRTSC